MPSYSFNDNDNKEILVKVHKYEPNVDQMLPFQCHDGYNGNVNVTIQYNSNINKTSKNTSTEFFFCYAIIP